MQGLDQMSEICQVALVLQNITFIFNLFVGVAARIMAVIIRTKLGDLCYAAILADDIMRCVSVYVVHLPNWNDQTLISRCTKVS